MSSASRQGVLSAKCSRVDCRFANQEVYRRLRLVPRVMRDVSNVDMATTMLGKKMVRSAELCYLSAEPVPHVLQ